MVLAVDFQPDLLEIIGVGRYEVLAVTCFMDAHQQVADVVVASHGAVAEIVCGFVASVGLLRVQSFVSGAVSAFRSADLADTVVGAGVQVRVQIHVGSPFRIRFSRCSCLGWLHLSTISCIRQHDIVQFGDVCKNALYRARILVQFALYRAACVCGRLMAEVTVYDIDTRATGE